MCVCMSDFDQTVSDDVMVVCVYISVYNFHLLYLHVWSQCAVEVMDW